MPAEWRMTVNGVEHQLDCEDFEMIEVEPRVRWVDSTSGSGEINGGFYACPPNVRIPGWGTYVSGVGYYAAGDSAPIDRWPDPCWRCDAAPGRPGLGLCADCLNDLR